MRYPFILLVVFLLGGSAHAQEELLQNLKLKLSESRQQFPAMRPQVFFAQDKYAPGDTAFFRLFILTESERILAERSLLTLELLNSRGIICARQMVSCQRFGAANQLILPDSLSPGFYETRFFSDRMTMAYGLSTHLMIVGEKKLDQLPRTGEVLTAYVEGGHIVPGVLNRVVLRANGKIPASASLHSNEGRVTSIAFDDRGLASVQFLPGKDQEYHVEYGVADKVLRHALPAVELTAVNVRVYRGPKQTWVLDMASGPKGPKSVSLLLLAGREVYHAQEVKFDAADRSSVLAAADFFPEGFSELFLVDKELHVLAYRPMYITPNAQGSISISGLPESAALRQEVTVNLSIADATGKPIGAGVAVAVVPDEVRLRPLKTPDATLELRPQPPWFDWTQPATVIDQELIANPAPTKVIPDFPLLIHNSNLTLSGKVYSKRSAEPIPYMSRIVIYLQKDLIQYETAVDGVGNFSFPKLYDFMGSDKIFYKVINNGILVPQAAVDWSVNAGEMMPALRDRFAETSQPDNYGTLRKRKRIIDRSFNFFLSSEPKSEQVTNFNAQLEDEFQYADITVNPGEYVSFETMKELILEVIPALKFRYRGGDSIVHLDLYNHSPFVLQRYAEGSPLYVIDGCMTTNTRYFLSLSPKEIVSVKIINEIGKLDRLENLAKDGVVFVQTRFPERTRKDLESELHSIDGLSPTLLLTSGYVTKPRVPDLRSLLYWTPLTETDSTGKANFTFRTSDIPGAYWIRIMGTTSAGHLVTTEQRFVVNFK